MLQRFPFMLRWKTTIYRVCWTWYFPLPLSFKQPEAFVFEDMFNIFHYILYNLKDINLLKRMGVSSHSRERSLFLFRWWVVDIHLAEVSWPNLPILPLRHQRNRVHPPGAVRASQRSGAGGGGRWWRRRRGSCGYWRNGKGNSCPEEGV